ncbi:Tetraspanin family-domain-containing protein [Radiomyces spectabilis]|uniref:Tetraspanin family-domain-containing protein n=1 Tax=Radiomyces spectabilis TaxID=64574 RepID=UPI00221F1361|nr:Tetraspanin family-domain-containing protein [Radiomyces spectabilis]KAI8371377.1 Tetraspanin family-domain-containing protein [Radiomyces spectabilis]
MIFGCIILFTSFIGCFGAHVEHVGFLKVYSSITASFLVAQLTILGFAYAHRRQFDQYGSAGWDFFHENDPRFLLQIEETLQCCGYNSSSDRPLSGACYAVTGCKDAFINVAQQWHQWIVIGVIMILGLQLVVLLTVLILTIIIEREAREDEVNMSLLSSSNHNHTWLSPERPGFSPHGSSNSYFSRHPQPTVWSRPSYGSSSTSSSPRVPRYGSTQFSK